MQINVINERKIGVTENLTILKLNIGAQVIMTTNINLEDRLVMFWLVQSWNSKLPLMSKQFNSGSLLKMMECQQ